LYFLGAAAQRLASPLVLKGRNLVSFPTDDVGHVLQVHRAMKEIMDLLAIILSGGSTKYPLSNPEHLPIA